MFEEFSSGIAVTWIYGSNYRPVEGIDRYLYGVLSGYPKLDLYFSGLRWAGWTITDMFDDIAAFPVPPRTVPFAANDGQNLQALLSAAVATPERLLHTNDGSLEQECAELAVFAAACLNLSGECSPGRWDLDGDSRVEFADRLARLAQTWLGNNIPRFVYATEVEGLIVQASAIPA